MNSKDNYLTISKASDIENKSQRMFYRMLEILPGVISLGTLVGVLFFSCLLPAWVSIFVICFCLYYLLRILYFSVHQVTGYFKVKEHMRRNWIKELKKMPGEPFRNIYHLVILPTYKEGSNIIEESIQSLVQSEYPKEKMMVVLSVEERAGRN